MAAPLGNKNAVGSHHMKSVRITPDLTASIKAKSEAKIALINARGQAKLASIRAKTAAAERKREMIMLKMKIKQEKQQAKEKSLASKIVNKSNNSAKTKRGASDAAKVYKAATSKSSNLANRPGMMMP
jgi:hypothetical protein